MKYYFTTRLAEENHAGTKAVQDANTVLESKGFLPISQKYTKGKIARIILLAKLFFKIDDCTRNVNEGDIVIFQLPMSINENFQKIILKRVKRKKAIVCFLIHDIAGLRINETINENERRVFSLADYVISHNDSMTTELLKTGVINKNQIVDLEIFDYLLEQAVNNDKKKLSNGVIISGNLMRNKVAYIYNNLEFFMTNAFNLYGPGFENSELSIYKGSFKPSEIPDEMSGSFGLVWDGDSLDTCNGQYGEYLKYNNPHKVSLYLTAGFPVIVWKKSALTSFVIENELGFAVESLREVPEIINAMSKEEYDVLLQNVQKVSGRLIEGFYLSNALSEIEKKIKQL